MHGLSSDTLRRYNSILLPKNVHVVIQASFWYLSVECVQAKDEYLDSVDSCFFFSDCVLRVCECKSS